MDLGLKGKKALITGGSRGIGRAIAEVMVAEGADLAICARNADGLDAAKAALGAGGQKVFAEAVDVADGEAYKKFIADSAQALGGLDIFVHNTSGGGGANEEVGSPGTELEFAL